MLLFMALFCLLFLLILKFAIIHYPADRRFAVRHYLNEVQPRFLGHIQRPLNINNSNLIVLGIYQPYRAGLNQMI